MIFLRKKQNVEKKLLYILSSDWKKLGIAQIFQYYKNAEISDRLVVVEIVIKILDCHFTMNAHVSNIARAYYFELHFLSLFF